MSVVPGTRPTYGNWRRPRSAGLGRLGTVSTAALGVAMVVTFIVAAMNMFAGLTLMVVFTGAFLPLVIHDRWGRTGYERLGDVVRWKLHRNRRGHLYVAGPLSRTPSVECRLPGLAARLEVFDAQDAIGRPFVVLHHPRPGHVATVLECSPPGVGLIDDDTIDGWVANWGAWLAELGQESGVVAAQVVVETRPDPGVELRRSVTKRLSPDGPEFAHQVMQNIVEILPAGSASTRVFVTLTWGRSRVGGGGRRALDDVVLEIGQRLPELCQTLSLTGAGTARPIPEERLAAAVRTAFDPSIIPTLEESGESIEWANAGPVQAEATSGVYRHDSAVSVSWVMGQAPTGVVRSNVLQQLLRPSPDVAMKRITLLYRPYTPARAAQIVDQDRRITEFQARQKRMGRARDVMAIRIADRTAEEEAAGAGLLRFGMIATATMWNDTGKVDRDTINRGVNVVEQLGGAARIRFRRAWRMQESTFLAGLPLGIVLPAHVSVPKEWRDL